MMIGKLGKHAARSVALAGGLGLLVAAAAAIADPGGAIGTLRENGFDRMLSLFPRPVGHDPPLVVDIDREALAKFGPWPWPRDRLALLIGRIATAQPNVLVID